MIKVLVVGHTPPPHLGLPIMLEALVRSKMPGVELRHLRIDLSQNESQVGKFRWSKLLRVIPLIIRIVCARIAFRPHILYYAPAGPSRMGMLRDVVVLGTARLLFPKTVLHFHAGGHGAFYAQLPRWKRWLFRRAYFHPEATIRVSDRTPEDGKALKTAREFIVPNGIVDLGADLPLPRPAPVISEDRPLRLLFVALLCESKGLLVLIDACGELAARGVPFRLDLMGGFESEEFAARVRHRVAELRIDDRVNYLGVLTGAEKLAAFRRTDVLCHPTFNDTFGLVLLEAMACGIPVVATRWCSIPLIVDDGQTGFLVETHDPVAVADCVAELASDPPLRREMGMAGREKFLREFTLPRHIERMRLVFLDVAGQASTVNEVQPRRELVGVAEMPEPSGEY